MKDIKLKSDSTAFKYFLQNMFSIFILEILRFIRDPRSPTYPIFQYNL